MFTRLKAFLEDRSGASALDYSIITAVVAIVCIAVLLERFV